MKFLAPLMAVFMVGCYDTRTGASCAQPYGLWAYAENRTGQPQTLQFSYNDPQDGNRRNTIDATIPAGGTFEQKLRDYSVVHDGTASMSGPRAGSCSSVPYKTAVDLNLTPSSFGQVKNCVVGGETGLVYLVSLSSACPDFTTQQMRSM